MDGDGRDKQTVEKKKKRIDQAIDQLEKVKELMSEHVDLNLRWTHTVG